MTDSGLKTFSRGLRILEVLCGAGGGGLKIQEIATRTGLQRPTVYRYMDVLTKQGYVTKTAADGRFVFNASRMASETTIQPGIDSLRPALQRISAITGDCSFLIRREAADSLCIHREVGSYPVHVRAVTIGHRQPLGVGAAGLALLSSLPEKDINWVIDTNKSLLALYGGMSEARLRKLIENTRERGWAVVGNSAVPGVVGVGVAVPASAESPIFGVSVSSSIEHMSLARQRFVVETIRAELR